MSELERPVFCKWDPDEITQRDVEFVETKLGKTLFPAQPERIFVDFVAYVECLIRQQIQEAAEQTLTEYWLPKVRRSSSFLRCANFFATTTWLRSRNCRWAEATNKRQPFYF